ncbi:uridine phosphorylase [Zhouia amylolytica]|uniref:Uridine phosphorylase n=1 Tax=Zhouia amylolytica TaxID=376730 RepID=A0A1I6UL39_9FLAO|nr:nucleoside phosphorylase [Zhouia amylolytica]MCQ0112696.1 nucleoside phosphorylase [Zhouia amylolytica]SFT02074.1 uridine phosphorylase [Zhouia amylolytica]
MSLEPSELILNPDGSIYHLNLLPEDIADTVITVGDPDRVTSVSRYFDRIEIKKGKREFVTHTGELNGKRLSVISTGIGTDNIDIVLNELDALVNIDLKNRQIKNHLKSIDIIRIGTSGSLQPDIPVDSFLLSEYAIGFDSLLHYYLSKDIQHQALQEDFIKHTLWSKHKSTPYIVGYNSALGDLLNSDQLYLGMTGTNVGFYGPQGRVLRLPLSDADLNDKLASFEYRGLKVTNLEMETAGIYGLAKLLGHRAASMNCIIANRPNGTFSKDPKTSVDNLIKYTLEKLTN